MVQEIESTDLGKIIEKVKSVAALNLPFELTAEVQTTTLGENQYRHLLYTLCVKDAPRGAVIVTIGDSWLVKE